MKFSAVIVCFLLIYAHVKSQNTEVEWYSETKNNGITIQNSFPKGGPYNGAVKKHYNYSYLVFFSRVINQSKKSFELKIDFPIDSIGIPGSPDTFMKVLLPPDEMTFEKFHLFSYGLTEFESFDKSTTFQKTLRPNQDYLFYVVTIFYQTKSDVQKQQKGGNRAELILDGHNLFLQNETSV